MSSASPAVPRWVTAASGALSLRGMAVLILALTLGFETPSTPLLLVSAMLTFAAPLAALWHFVATRALTPDEKRIWLRELTGPDVFSAISEYMGSSDLRASAQRRAADAALRRAQKNQT